MPNAELARRILNAINQHPENFDMHAWFARSDGSPVLRAAEEMDCGTTMCLAGWACHLSGYTLIERVVDDAGGSPTTLMIASKDGVERDLIETALGLLDLKHDTVFYVDEDRAEQWLRYVAALGLPALETAP